MTSKTNHWKTGTILWFNLGKGFGYIRPDDPDEDDVRFDVSAFVDANINLVDSGVKVEYVAEQLLIGMCATSVRSFPST